MKKTLLMAAALILVMQAPALYAVDIQHPGKQGPSKAMQKGAGGSMKDMGMMKQNMHKMMKQMKEIHATNDPEKRKKLMHEHMQNMNKGMQMMQGMGGDMMMGMMGDKKGDGGMMGKGMDKKNMDSNDMAKRHQMMEQRMDMMQMMMEQMMGQMTMQENMKSPMRK